MELHIVPVKDLEKHRTIVLPYISSFVERSKGRFDSDYVFERIKKEMWTLWVVHENLELRAVLLTQIIKYPKLREFQIIMCVGRNHKDWYSLVTRMEEYAKLIGCKKLTAVTRPGWEKVMVGYKKSHIYLERDL